MATVPDEADFQALFDNLDASVYTFLKRHVIEEGAREPRVDYVVNLIDDENSYVFIGVGSLKDGEFNIDYNLVKSVIDDFNNSLVAAGREGASIQNKPK